MRENPRSQVVLGWSKTCLHETSFPLDYGAENLSDNLLQFPIDLNGQNQVPYGQNDGLYKILSKIYRTKNIGSCKTYKKKVISSCSGGRFEQPALSGRPFYKKRCGWPARPARPARSQNSPKMILPNRPGTYLIRRALKNESGPCNKCSKRSHERQVMTVFVEKAIVSWLSVPSRASFFSSRNGPICLEAPNLWVRCRKRFFFAEKCPL